MASQPLPEDLEQLRNAVAERFLKGAGREGRPHQVDAVVSLVCDVRADVSCPSATNYLLQHAAGSGKSLTIAALAAALLDTVDAAGQSFHTVLVVNDRLQLDKQLGDTVKAFITGLGHPAGTVARANSSSELQQYLSAPLSSPKRPKIILTTIQKLSSIWRASKHKAAAAAGSNGGSNGDSSIGRVAIIADEAHRHHGSSTSEQTSAIMAAAFAGSSSGSNAAAAQQQQQQGSGVLVQQPRFVTYFGFTATPGPRALQLFGVSQAVEVDPLGDIHTEIQQQQQQQQQQQEQQMVMHPAVLYRPFHAYSLQEATTDGLVLDALQRFIAVTPRFEIAGLQLTEQQRQQLIQLDAASTAAVAGAGGSGSSTVAAAARKRKLQAARRAAAAAASSNGQPPGSSSSSSSLAAALLIQAANDSRQLVAVKAEQVVSRFLEAWGSAAAQGFVDFRAMLVVRSRQHVVWYCQEVRRQLQGHTDRIQELLKAAGLPEDSRASRSSAAGDTRPLCYGAFSGNIRVSGAEAAALTTAAAAGADADGGSSRRGLKRKHSSSNAAAGEAEEGQQQQQQQQQQRRQRSGSGSGWDSALASLETAAEPQQQQQDVANGSTSESEGQQVEVSQSESASESESDSKDSLFDDSSSSSDCEGESGNESESDKCGGSESEDGSRREHLFGSVTGGSACAAAVAGAAGSDTDQEPAEPTAAAAVGVASGQGATASTAAAAAAAGAEDPVRPRKRPRRNTSRLSCNTAQTDTAAAVDEDDAGTAQQQQPSAAAAAAADDAEVCYADVMLSEGDINPGWVRPGDARLLVVCNKFETGYDDPRLGALFVDRVLSGARAVQVLGRINRPAPSKPGCLLVVDFVNSAVAIREAFGEYYGTTTFCTGTHAKRRRQLHALDESLNRILETLQPAAARHAAAATLAHQQQQQQQQQQIGPSSTPHTVGAAAAAADGAVGSAQHLTSMSVTEVASLTDSLSPAAHKALETDLGSYCSLCHQLNMQKLEFPCAFASALAAEVTEQRQRRERLAAAASEDGVLGEWVSDTVGAIGSSAAAAAADEDGSGGSMEQFQQQQQQQQQQQRRDESAAAAADDQPGTADQPSTAKPAASLHKQKLNVSVRVCELETTFAGPVRLQNPTHLKPLSTIRLGGGRSAAAAAAAAAATAADPDACVRLGRPLSEVIAAANAQLAGRYRKQVAAGLWELCERLKGATAPAAAPTAAAAAGSEQQPQEQRGLTAAAAGEGANGAGGAGSNSSASGGDVFSLLELLRRMMLWPVTAELLRTTAAGKQVAALKQHPDPQVSTLAEQVVQQWRASLARQAMAAAAAKARKDTEKGGKGGSMLAGEEKGWKSGREGLVVDAALQSKVVGMRDALLDHRKAVMGAEQQQQQQQKGGSGSSQQQQEQQLTAERPQLQELAERLEAAVQRYIQPQAQQEAAATAAVGSTAAAGGGGSNAQSAAVLLQLYKARVRMLCTGLRYPDGVSPELIAGDRAADEVAALDALALAPAAVQEAVQKRQEKQARGEAAWESMMSDSVGGGGTHLSTEVTCPSCGEKRAQVHTILSGGTYAQERVQIQKFVCQGCNTTWRSHD